MSINSILLMMFRGRLEEGAARENLPRIVAIGTQTIGKECNMSRSRLLIMAVALAASGVGCAHCTTCDEFPTSFAASPVGYDPNGAFAAGPMPGAYIDGPIADYAVPAAPQFMAVPGPNATSPTPPAQPGPFAPPAVRPSAGATGNGAGSTRPTTESELPAENVAPSTVEPLDAPPTDLDLSLPEPGGLLDLPVPGETP